VSKGGGVFIFSLVVLPNFFHVGEKVIVHNKDATLLIYFLSVQSSLLLGHEDPFPAGGTPARLGMLCSDSEGYH
jgi:hypothetical protein